jgi:microcystin-dependent protein
MDPFVAEIRIFAGNFAPHGWALCNGQLMAISQNTALFSLLGTIYGGDGKSTFALPDLQARAPMFWGWGPGLSEHWIGEEEGQQSVTLIEPEIPAHSHSVQANNLRANSFEPGGNALARSAGDAAYQSNPAASPVNLHPAAVNQVGSSLPHNNLQPYLTLTFIIALQGIYPPRS